MIEIALNNLQNLGNQKLTSSILPNFAHRCARLNWQSYDTSAKVLFKFKRDFKRFKRVCALQPSNFLYWRKLPLEILIKSQVLCLGIWLHSRGFKDYLKAFKNNFRTTVFLNKLIAIHLFKLETMERSICVSDRRVNLSTRISLSLCSFLLIERELI